MKRTIKISSNDGEVRVNLVAKVNTGNRGLTKRETDVLARRIANNLFHAVATPTNPWVNFDATNTTVSV